MKIRNHAIAGIATLAVATISVNPAEAAPSMQEHMGVGAGLVVGAIAGGPVGALLGAAVGAKLGDSYHRQDETLADLNADLDGSRKNERVLSKRVAHLASDNKALDAERRELQSMNRPEILSMLKAGIEMDLLFRTDEHVLMDATSDRIRSLAATLASMNDVYVKVDGYSDERGDADYNRQLSKRRAEHVRDVLLASGLPENRIRMSAHGESPAADPTVDSYALERKVSLTLFLAESPSVAASH